jgi:hypothetical protein
MRSVPSNVDKVGQQHAQNMTSDQEVKTDVGTVTGPHIEAAAAAVGANDTELEARTRRLEQLRIQHGVSGQRIPMTSRANPTGTQEHLGWPG